MCDFGYFILFYSSSVGVSCVLPPVLSASCHDLCQPALRTARSVAQLLQTGAPQVLLSAQVLQARRSPTYCCTYFAI